MMTELQPEEEIDREQDHEDGYHVDQEPHDEVTM